MSEPLLHDRTLNVDRGRVGISYSGAGSLLLVELGVARAFVDLGIRPYAIAGVSAGAITAVAHAIDPLGGAGIAAAAKGLERVSNRSLGLTLLRVLARASRERTHLMGLGSNESIQGMLAGAFRELAGSERVTVDYFGRDGRPKLVISATDRLTGETMRFPGDADVADALVATSAIPGIFEPKAMTVGGVDRLLVDGGVVDNQPLSALALEGCGTLYACAIGYDGEALRVPANLLDNAMTAFSIALHAASRLEQDYVQLRLDGAGVVHHIHPPVLELPVRGFDFTRDVIAQVMRDACEKTKRWITEHHLLPEETGDA
jgi:predicted acylesterase/phospholipase RssA